MRKFELDNKVVIAPNASLLGYGRRKVKRGDVFTYDNGDGQTHVARSLGRISKIDDGMEDARGWIVALVLGAAADHAFVRWIDPRWVREVRDAPAKFAAFFFSAELPHSPDMLLKLAEYGTLSEQFIDKADHHVEAWRAGVSPAAWNAGVRK